MFISNYFFKIRSLFFLSIIINISNCFGQTDTHNIDTTFGIYHQIKHHYYTVGLNSDVVNSLYGVTISNGSDEQPIIHFEELNNKVLLKLNGQIDKENNYTMGAKFSLNYPWRISLASIDYIQRNIRSINLFSRDINLSTEIYLKRIDLILITKLGYKEMNENKNIGTSIGLQKSYRKIYFGLIGGYYIESYNYSAFTQFYILKSTSLRFCYEKISKYDFLNMEVHFTFKKAIRL